MHHSKRLFFGIILLSSFGSAFADEYDPKQDVFDQVINALVPTLIVFLFDTKEREKVKEPKERDLESKERNSEESKEKDLEEPKTYNHVR